MSEGGICILGYGLVGDFPALVSSRTRVGPPLLDTKRHGMTEKQFKRFEAFAKMLGHLYPYPGSGADRTDVEQRALVAAWDAIEEFNRDSEGRLFEPFVKQRMRWRVIDFVRIRTEAERKDAERFSLLEDLPKII